MKRWILSLVCVMISALTAWAAFDPNGISMTASVNKTSLTLDDELTLTVTVDGAAGDLVAPQLPSLPAFNVYARSTSKQIHNFHATSTFEYVMLPRFAGKAVIGPITLHYGNKTYQTDPITVTVYRTPTKANTKNTPTAPATAQKRQAPAARQTATPQPAPTDLPPLERDLYMRASRQTQDYFMLAAVSDSSPYANQTFTLAVRFYYDAPFSGNAPYTAPTLNNLVVEELGRAEGRQTIAGKLYDYIEIRYAATGVMSGAAQINPASITYIPISRRDFSLFDRMFASVSQEPQTVQSNPISLTIRPVPSQDRPKSFYGAVGNGYHISAEIDRSQVEAGDAVNLTVKVNGDGNLKATEDLKLPQMAGFKIYDVVTTSGAVPSNGTLKSYKIFKTVLVPLSSGNYLIPPLAWSYYDPAKKQYLTLNTQPLELEVTPSSKTDTGFDFTSQTDLGNGFQELGQDIHYLKSTLAEKQNSFLRQVANLWWMCYLFLALLLVAAGFALADKNTLASKRALAKARHNLKKAYTEETVADALSLYLQLTYHVSTASLPLRDIEKALKQKGCSEELTQRFAALWQQLDVVRFAPVALQGQSTQNLAQQALELMKAMDKEKHL